LEADKGHNINRKTPVQMTFDSLQKSWRPEGRGTILFKCWEKRTVNHDLYLEKLSFRNKEEM
jgi:hypothetical protein